MHAYCESLPSCFHTGIGFFFGIACIYAVRIQPGIRAQWASHGIALAWLVGLFVIAAGTLTAFPGKSRPALPFLIGLLLFIVGISGIALILFPEIVPFSVQFMDYRWVLSLSSR
jgi:cytochrome bd-type quinol oxidase subunit 2